MRNAIPKCGVALGVIMSSDLDLINSGSLEAMRLLVPRYSQTTLLRLLRGGWGEVAWVLPRCTVLNENKVTSWRFHRMMDFIITFCSPLIYHVPHTIIEQLWPDYFTPVLRYFDTYLDTRWILHHWKKKQQQIAGKGLLSYFD